MGIGETSIGRVIFLLTLFGVKLRFMEPPGSRGTFVVRPWFAVKKEEYAPSWIYAGLHSLVFL